MEEEGEETYVLQFAAIKLCKFTVIRENLSIFTVIKKNVAAITPLGDFDMRPKISLKIFYLCCTQLSPAINTRWHDVGWQLVSMKGI